MKSVLYFSKLGGWQYLRDVFLSALFHTLSVRDSLWLGAIFIKQEEQVVGSGKCPLWETVSWRLGQEASVFHRPVGCHLGDGLYYSWPSLCIYVHEKPSISQWGKGFPAFSVPVCCTLCILVCFPYKELCQGIPPQITNFSLRFPIDKAVRCWIWKSLQVFIVNSLTNWISCLVNFYLAVLVLLPAQSKANGPSSLSVFQK